MTIEARYLSHIARLDRRGLRLLKRGQFQMYREVDAERDGFIAALKHLSYL